MNTLSHYLLDKDHPSPYYILGVIMPDMVTHFNRHLRRAVFSNQELDDINQLMILNGIKRHYQVDALFHRSAFFNRYSNFIKELILSSDLPSFHYRAFFLSHVLLEMLLDRLLIKQYSDLAVKLYSTIKSINLKTVSSYLIRIGKPDFQTEFFDTFTGFIKRQYLFYYTDNEKFIRALVWMYKKANPVTPAPEEVQQLSKLINKIELDHKNEMLDIFSWLRKQLLGV